MTPPQTPAHPYARGLCESVLARAATDLARLPQWLSRCRAPLPPLALVADLGAILAGPGVRPLAPSARGRYAEAVRRWGTIPAVETAAGLHLRDAVVAAVVASIVRDLPDLRAQNLSAGDVAALLDPPADGPAEPPWATPTALASIDERLAHLDLAQLRRAAAVGAGAGLSAAAWRDLTRGLSLPEARAAAAVAQRLLPVLRFTAPPRGTQLAATGGYADLTRRGELDSLLLSELALPKDEFLRRYAESELLHYSREAPPTHRPRRVACFVDTGPLAWGAPRLLGCGAAIALDALCRRRGDGFSLALPADDGQVDLLPLDEPGLLRLLGHRTWDLDPAPHLAQLAQALPRGGSDLVAVVPPDAVDRALAVLRRAASVRAVRSFIVEVASAGLVRLLQVAAGSEHARLVAAAEVGPALVEHALERTRTRLAPAGAGALPGVHGAVWGSPAAIRFTADGRHLVVVDALGTAAVREASDGRLVATAAVGAPLGLAVSGANELVVRTADGFAVYALPSLERVATAPCPAGPIDAFAVGRGRMVAVAGPSGIAVAELGSAFRCIWRDDIPTGPDPGRPPWGPVAAEAPGPAGSDARARSLREVAALCLVEPSGPEAPAIAVAGLSTGEIVAAALDGSASCRVRLGLERVAHLASDGSEVVAVSGATVAALSFGENLSPTSRLLPFSHTGAPVVAVAPSASHVASTPAYRQLAVYAIDGRQVCTFEEIGGYRDVELSADGLSLALAFPIPTGAEPARPQRGPADARGEPPRPPRVAVLRTTTADLAFEVACTSDRHSPVHLSVSADGLAAALVAGSHVGVFGLDPSGASARRLVAPGGSGAEVRSCALSPAGTEIAWVLADGGLRVAGRSLRIPTGAEPARPRWGPGAGPPGTSPTAAAAAGSPRVEPTRGEGRPIRHRRLTFSPDGRRVLARGADGAVRVYDAATLRRLRTFRAAALFGEPAFLPGDLVALPSRDGFTVASLASGHPVRSPFGDRAIVAVAVTPSGRATAVLSADGRIAVTGARAAAAVQAEPGESRLAVADDGTLAVASATRVRLVRPDVEPVSLRPLLGPATDLAFGGPFLFVATAPGVATVFSARTGEARAHLTCGPYGAILVARSGRCAGDPEGLERVAQAAATIDPEGAAAAIWEGFDA